MSDVELLWTVMAFIGLVFSLFNLWDAINDRRIIRDETIKWDILSRRVPRHVYERIATVAVRKEWLRLVRFVIKLSLGLLAASIPPAVYESQQTLSQWVAYGLLAMMFTSMTSAVLDRIERHAVLEDMVRAQRPRQLGL